jgi:hypothetical protein
MLSLLLSTLLNQYKLPIPIIYLLLLKLILHSTTNLHKLNYLSFSLFFNYTSIYELNIKFTIPIITPYINTDPNIAPQVTKITFAIYFFKLFI